VNIGRRRSKRGVENGGDLPIDKILRRGSCEEDTKRVGRVQFVKGERVFVSLASSTMRSFVVPF